VLLLLVGGVVMPLISQVLQTHEQKMQQLFRLQRLHNSVARETAIADNWQTLQQQVAEQQLFNGRDTEAMASADMQTQLKAIVTDAGGQLTSTQGLPGRLDNGFMRIAVKVRLTCSVDALRDMLFRLNTASPLLMVDQLDVTPIHAVFDTHAKNNPTTQLNVSLQVFSMMRGVSHEP
jgi:general secretion pathway protein M